MKLAIAKKTLEGRGSSWSGKWHHDGKPIKRLFITCITGQTLELPDVLTVKGLRDPVILAVLLGCDLRRECASLNAGDIQQREE